MHRRIQNQHLLNFNTVYDDNPLINTSLDAMNLGGTRKAEDYNNPLRLENITNIVNNSNSSDTASDTSGSATSGSATSGGTSGDTSSNPALKYKIIRYLGRGVQGNLYLALDARGNRVICKEIQLDTDPSNNAEQKKQLDLELHILKYLSSNTVAREHINPCLDHKIHQNHVYTIFPVFKGYSLGYFRGHMLKLPNKNDYYKIAFVLIKSLLHALAKVHDAGIAHQNITSNSILVSTFLDPNKIKIKFTDFGIGCGCPKDLAGNLVVNEESSMDAQSRYENITMIPWQKYKLDSSSDSNPIKISSCKENGHAPVKYVREILARLKDSDYLKISQKYDVLCIGLIILKFLIYFDAEMMLLIDNLLDTTKLQGVLDNHKLQILRDKINGKYFDNHYPDIDSVVSDDKKVMLEYLKLIWKYMMSQTVERRSAQYVLDKIIIYEKYKNDIF